MSNPEYIFTERFFHRKRNELVGDDFLKGMGIDPFQEITSQPLTLSRLKAAGESLGFTTRNVAEDTSNGEWQWSIERGDAYIWLIVRNFAGEDTEMDDIEIGRGSDPKAVIEVFHASSAVCGKFLFYSSTGIMTSIMFEKPVELSIKEFVIKMPDLAFNLR